MTHPANFHVKIIINTEPICVWKALIENQYVPSYMFGAKLNCTWQIGSKVEYYLKQKGQKQAIAGGVLLKFERNKLLEHSLIPSQAEYLKVQKNHLIIRYELQDLAGKTELMIRQTGFPRVAEGEKRLQESIKGWNSALPLLKQTAESIVH